MAASPALRLRSITPGREHIGPGCDPPRHRHLEAYVTVVLRGRYEQVGYGGRLLCEPGSILLQPTLDCHADRMLSPGVELIRLPWARTMSLGGLYVSPRVEEIAAAVERGDPDTGELLAEILAAARPKPPPAADWEDELARRLHRGDLSITAFAREVGVARETVPRRFRRAYGVTPARYRQELRARAAWGRITSGAERLCDIALQEGFADQSHMTRAVHALTGATPSAWRRTAF